MSFIQMQSLICELQEDLQSQNRTKTLTELSEDVQNHEPHVNVGEYLGGFLFQMIYEIKKNLGPDSGCDEELHIFHEGNFWPILFIYICVFNCIMTYFCCCWFTLPFYFFSFLAAAALHQSVSHLKDHS